MFLNKLVKIGERAAGGSAGMIVGIVLCILLLILVLAISIWKRDKLKECVSARGYTCTSTNPLEPGMLFFN